MRIIAATVSTVNITLYKEDGETIVLEQGDTRVAPILEVIAPQLNAQGFAELPDAMLEVKNVFNTFAENNPFIKFVQIAKEALAMYLYGNGGLKGPDGLPTTDKEIRPVATNSVSPEVLGQIIDNSTKVMDTSRVGHNKPDTIVAITDGAIIPEAENLTAQLTHFSTAEDAKGFKNFLARIEKVIAKRGHSIKDLLAFMKRGDLPIADDGSIIIYKLLNRKGDKYVDVHSGNVLQQVGSRVFMAEKLVDPDRRNQCSNGLHIARRGYLRGFSGNVCVIAKVAPEDVIAVPSYDADKMRVCGYNIVYELPDVLMNQLKANKAMTESAEGRKILGAMIAGNHTGIIETVEIRGPRGSDLLITPVDPTKTKGKNSDVSKDKEVTAIADEAMEIAQVAKGKKMDSSEIRDLAQKSSEQKGLSRKEEARKRYDLFKTAKGSDRVTRIRQLKDYKQGTKVSWEKLGFNMTEIEKINTAIGNLL